MADNLVKITNGGATTRVTEAEITRYLRSGWRRVEEVVAEEVADPNAADPNAADPNAADPNAADPNAAKVAPKTTGSRR